MDDFEKKLRHQQLRPIPGEWRETILRAAQERAVRSGKFPKPVLNHFLASAWRELVRPCRYAWASMAALWLVFGIINERSETAPLPNSTASTAATPQAIGLIEQKRRALVELTGPLDLATSRRSLPTAAKPHTQRAVTTRNC